MCTKFQIILISAFFIISETLAAGGLYRPKRSIDGDLSRCTPGDKWYEECNRCICTDNGQTICTSWPCHTSVPDNSFRSMARRICHLGEMWMRDCNLCMCTGFGRVSCTEYDCSKNERINGLKTKREPKEGKLCTAGTTWKENCNTCVCGDFGVVGCTLFKCDKDGEPVMPDLTEPDNESEAENRRKRETGKLCTAGTTWKENCNTCVCGDFGVVACTLFKCDKDGEPIFPDLTEPDNETEVERRKRKTVKLCTPGTTWKEWCNTCVCRESRLVACTVMQCGRDGQPIIRPEPIESDDETEEEDRRKRETERSCVPGTSWNDGCNTCFCSETGHIGCSAKYCFNKDEIPTVRQKREAERPCVPGTSWHDGCNSCFCSETGHAACTLKYCFNKDEIPTDKQKREAERSCVPGTNWHDGCNRCFCSETGQTACTRKHCYNKDEIAKLNLKREAGKLCTPGTTWKEDCNTCFCGDFGVVGCTLMQCGKDGQPILPDLTENDDDEMELKNRRKRESEPMVIEDGQTEQQNIMTFQELEATCEVGKTVKYDCNICHCTDRGLACTRRLCHGVEQAVIVEE